MLVKLEKRGVLGAGQVQKGGSLPRHIPILNIYVSTPPPPRGGHSKNAGGSVACHIKRGVLGTGTTLGPGGQPQTNWGLDV